MNTSLLETLYPMNLIDSYKATLWNSDWLHLEVIIVASTRIIASRDAPSRTSSNFFLVSDIIGVMEIIVVVVVILYRMTVVIIVATILTHFIRLLVYLGDNIGNYPLQLNILIYK